MKNKPGRPPKQQTKKHKNLRLSVDVLEIIEKQPNQQEYIENLVRNDVITKTN